MSTSNFTAVITVNTTPAQAFAAIINPRGWWSETIKGGTTQLNDEFDYEVEGLHTCKIKLTEVVPNKKVVWQVLDNYFSFTKDKTEWIGDKIIFEIAEKNGKTEIIFTQEGLTPADECYNICNTAWTDYLTNSLTQLIITGRGNPNQAYEDVAQRHA